MGIELKRGQLVRSYRTIQDDCSYYIGYRKKKPSLSTISRICEELTKDARIELRKERVGQVITILNYNKFQLTPNYEKNDERNDPGTTPELNNNVNNDIKPFILSDGTEYCPPKDYLSKLTELYPLVNLESEFRKMAGWCFSNPANRKTRRGATRFINNWISRAQERIEKVRQDEQPHEPHFITDAEALGLG